MVRQRCASLIWFVVVSQSQGLYFHVREGERRCFIEEVPDATMVLGQYENPELGTMPPSAQEHHEITVREQSLDTMLSPGLSLFDLKGHYPAPNRCFVYAGYAPR